MTASASTSLDRLARGVSGSGSLFAIVAYAIWGFAPIYWKQLEVVPATEVLAYRVIGSLIFYPMMALGPLVWPINLFVLLCALVGTIVGFSQATALRPHRAKWMVSFHVCFALLYLLPMLAIRFGTYVGP